MRRRLTAFLLCMLGMGALDHGLRFVAAQLAREDAPGSGAEAFLALARIEARVVTIGGAAGLILLWLLALLLSFPHGIRRNEQPWLLTLLAGFALGRSLLGVGEGFTTSFALPVLGCGLVALLAHALLPKRSR